MKQEEGTTNNKQKIADNGRGNVDTTRKKEE